MSISKHKLAIRAAWWVMPTIFKNGPCGVVPSPSPSYSTWNTSSNIENQLSMYEHDERTFSAKSGKLTIEFVLHYPDRTTQFILDPNQEPLATPQPNENSSVASPPVSCTHIPHEMQCFYHLNWQHDAQSLQKDLIDLIQTLKAT